jgi:hypothetical protein
LVYLFLLTYLVVVWGNCPFSPVLDGFRMHRLSSGLFVILRLNLPI